MRAQYTSTSGASASSVVRFNNDSAGSVFVQVVVTGTVAYTLQVSADIPGANGIADDGSNMTWFPTNDTAMVAATASAISNLQFVPAFARINQASGAGSTKATFIQAGGTGGT